MDKLMVPGRVSSFQDQWLTDSRFSNKIKRIQHRKPMPFAKSVTTSISMFLKWVHLRQCRIQMEHVANRKSQQPLAFLFKANKQTAPKATPSVPPISTSTCNDSVPETNNDASLSTQPKINSSNDGHDAPDAEIRWCLKLIESNGSYRSCLYLSQLFRKMVPDSEITSKFKLSKTESSYIISRGIAPYFFCL